MIQNNFKKNDQTLSKMIKTDQIMSKWGLKTEFQRSKLIKMRNLKINT